jgi:hypothetical protein
MGGNQFLCAQRKVDSQFLAKPSQLSSQTALLELLTRPESCNVICSELTMRQVAMPRLSSVGERILHRADKTDSKGDVSKGEDMVIHDMVLYMGVPYCSAASMSRAKDCPFSPGPGPGLSIHIQDSPKRYGHWLRSSEIQMQWRWGFWSSFHFLRVIQ